MLLLGWRRAYSFMFEDPRWRGKVFIGGLAPLLFPPFGWPLASRLQTAAPDPGGRS